MPENSARYKKDYVCTRCSHEYLGWDQVKETIYSAEGGSTERFMTVCPECNKFNYRPVEIDGVAPNGRTMIDKAREKRLGTNKTIAPSRRMPILKGDYR